MKLINIKRIMVIMILSLITITASAQTWRFQTKAYSQRELTNYGWQEWSDWESSNISITMNLDTDIVTIYSLRTQCYRVTKYVGNYVDNGANVAEYRMIDQDGDRGTLLLVIKPNGQSEIYIKFANVQWAYIVVRL